MKHCVVMHAAVQQEHENTVTQNIHNKLKKTRFVHLLQGSAGKQSGPILHHFWECLYCYIVSMYSFIMQCIVTLVEFTVKSKAV